MLRICGSVIPAGITSHVTERAPTKVTGVWARPASPASVRSRTRDSLLGPRVSGPLRVVLFSLSDLDPWPTEPVLCTVRATLRIRAEVGGWE